MKRACEYCGKEINTNRRNQKYCCTKCRKASEKKKRKEEPKKGRKEKEVSGLVQDAVEARKKGMTYGEYKAWQFWEEDRKRRKEKRK